LWALQCQLATRAGDTTENRLLSQSQQLRHGCIIHAIRSLWLACHRLVPLFDPSVAGVYWQCCAMWQCTISCAAMSSGLCLLGVVCDCLCHICHRRLLVSVCCSLHESTTVLKPETSRLPDREMCPLGGMYAVESQHILTSVASSAPSGAGCSRQYWMAVVLISGFLAVISVP
jgi:hypothetical protein